MVQPKKRSVRTARESVREARPQPPEFIIAFREHSDRKNVALLERVAGRLAHKQAKGRDVLNLTKRTGGRPKARMYQQLGVAVADLTPEELSALAARDDVEVTRNEIRGIPKDPDPIASPAGGTGEPAQPFGGTIGPVQPFGGTIGPVQPFGGIIGPVQPFGGTIGPVQPFEHVRPADRALLEYFRGYRDALGHLVAQLEARLVQSPAGITAASNPDLTYGLMLVGVTARERSLTGRGVKVAVLDTGIDLRHPDFARLGADPTRRACFVPGAEVQDTQGHGTHVAGTVVGPSASRPQYGVAPDCDLYVARVLDGQGFGYDSYILEAIEWAVEQGVRVINLSLGSARQTTTPFAKAYEIVAERLMDRRDGALLVAAAGNESQRTLGRIAPVGNPAACPSIMAIAAVDSASHVAWFSCGQQDAIGAVDLAAPGVAVLSAALGGGYAAKNGTSMAAPHVSGVAALYLEDDPSLTPRQLWDRLSLRARALPLSAPEDVGRGLAQIPVG